VSEALEIEWKKVCYYPTNSVSKTTFSEVKDIEATKFFSEIDVDCPLTECKLKYKVGTSFADYLDKAGARTGASVTSNGKVSLKNDYPEIVL